MYSLPSRSSTSLCATMRNLELSTYALMDQAARCKLQFPETALTAVNLTTIQTLNPLESIVIEQGRKEAVTGADWEWWLIGRTSVLGIRVQAKRLYLKSRRFEQLKESNRHGRQVDLLIKEALAARTYPLYCFYSTRLKSTDLKQWNCGTYSQSVQSMGCAIGDARAIRREINSGNLKVPDILQHCRPWSCLTCCPQASGLVQRASAVLADLGRGTGEDFLVPERDRGDIPDYVRLALTRDIRPSIPDNLSHVLVTIEPQESLA